jgi:hypothetical protein
MTAEQAKLIAAALTANHEADHDVAVGACLQAADELSVISQAISQGASDYLIHNALAGVEERLRAAAALAGELELARESGDVAEARQ